MIDSGDSSIGVVTATKRTPASRRIFRYIA
jgi:hypothetical protein